MDAIVEKYFRSQQSGLFKWVDNGRELCWLDGTTVSFHAELAVVIERLSRGSLPSFSSIIVAVAASRSTWPAVAQRITRLVRALQESELPSYAEAMRKHRYLTDTWQSSAEKLTLLSRYAAVEVQTPESRAELLATLFDHFESGYSEDEQTVLAKAFRAGLPEDWFFERKGDGETLTLPSTDKEEAEWRSRPPLFHRVLHDVLELLRIARVLASSLHDYSGEDLKQRVSTGVAADVVAVDESPLDSPQLAANLLDSLRNDPELAGFARLSRNLMAAVTLPRSLESALDIPAGGISDISNRGQLDKLLLSELAFDDLTLAVRIASNEAMYIRRESPPNPRVESRAVLIDNSLPMWGIPKLYATAMAMALCADSHTNLKAECYRADGDQLVRVSFSSRDAVTEQLTSLATVEHSGAAISAFEDAVLRQSHSAEPVIITTGDVLECSGFKRALERSTLKNVWVIAVERDGRLSVLQRTVQGTSVRKQIQLRLDDILSRPNTTIRRSFVSGELPDIFRRAEFPFRLSHQTRAGRVFAWGDELVAVADDGRLMLWSGRRLGAKQICDDLPRRGKTNVHLVSRDAAAVRLFVPGEASELITVSRFGEQLNRVVIQGKLDGVRDVRSVGAALLLFCMVDGYERVIAIDEKTGRTLANRVLPKEVYRNGRCLLGNNKWSLLTFDGQELGGQKLPSEFSGAKDVVELAAGEFLMIDKAGQIVDPGGELRFKEFRRQMPRAATRLFGYLPGGDRIGVAWGDNVSWGDSVSLGNNAILLNVKTEQPESFKHSWTGAADFEFQEARKTISMRTPRWKFRRIGIDGNAGHLVLQAASGLLFAIKFNSALAGIELVAADQTSRTSRFFDFESCAAPDGVGYRLQVAQIADVGSAWLDSRGLLHLKCDDGQYPQVSFAVQDGQLSGWLSTGEVFGEDYYFGRKDRSLELKQVSAAVAWESAVKPFIGIAPWSFHYT